MFLEAFKGNPVLLQCASSGQWDYGAPLCVVNDIDVALLALR